MAAEIGATLVRFTGCAAGPFGPSAPHSDVHQRLAEVVWNGAIKEIRTCSKKHQWHERVMKREDIGKED